MLSKAAGRHNGTKVLEWRISQWLLADGKQLEFELRQFGLAKATN
jgi:hypothetical protein